MGQRAVHCGGAGNGQAAKICNNMILGVTMIGTCEAFALADKLGLDRQALFDVVSTSSGSVLVDEHLLPGARHRPEVPGRQRLQARLRRRTDAQGPAPLPAGGRGGRRGDTPMGARGGSSSTRAFVEEEDGRGRDFSAMLPWLGGKSHAM